MGSANPDHVAPKGKFRVIVFDSFDHEQAYVGDFKTKEAACKKAESIGGTMTIAYVHNDKGEIVTQYGSY